MDPNLEITDLGNTKFFLGIDIIRNRKERTLKLTQKGYIERLIKEFTYPGDKGIKNPCQIGIKLLPNPDKASKKDIKFYQKSIGSLIYLMIAIRPDLAYPVTLLFRFITNPNQDHLNALSRIWKYFILISEKGLVYQLNIDLIIYCNFN